MADFQGWDPESSHPWAAHYRFKVRINDVTGTFQIVTGFGTLLTLVVEEPTGSASNRFELWDGTSTGGEYLGPWTLGAGQSIDNAYPPFGIPFRSGLFLNVTSGAVSGVAHIGTLVPWAMRYGSGEE